MSKKGFAALRRLQFLDGMIYSWNTRSSCRLMFTSKGNIKVQNKAEDNEGPIPFSKSSAASWNMVNTVMAPERDMPWYQPFSICLSVAVFLVYFLILREENDLDIELNRSLFERVPHLEESQLKVALEYNRQHGKDTRDLELRLAEIQREKTNKAS